MVLSVGNIAAAVVEEVAKLLTEVSLSRATNILNDLPNIENTML